MYAVYVYCKAYFDASETRSVFEGLEEVDDDLLTLLLMSVVVVGAIFAVREFSTHTWIGILGPEYLKKE